MRYYLGIDVGTSSTKSLLVSEIGEVIGSAQVPYDIMKGKLQYAEQDMELIWNAVKDTLCSLNASHSEEMRKVDGISYSGQMHGLVMLDVNQKLIRPAIIWADQRSGQSIEKMYELAGKETYRNEILNSLSTGFLAASLMWVKDQEPENYQMCKTVLFPKDYIRFRMCEELGTEMSDASSGAIFDTRNRDWSWKLIEKMGFDKQMFPPCHESCEIAGVVSETCARETGLKAGIRITYGGGDTLMQAVGNGLIEPGILAANIGTACQLCSIQTAPVYDPQFRTNTFCHVKEDLWMVMGAHLSGGVALKWLKNDVLSMESYDAMTELARKAPAGSEGLVFLPYLSGERTPYNDPDAKGIYFGLTLRHGRAHMIRSAMEGIIYGMRSSADIFREIGIDWNQIVASGGGARGRLFLEMQADILDSEIRTNQTNEQACMGAAITAAVGCKAYRDYKEACSQMVRYSDIVIVPDAENQKKYQESYAIFKELYRHNKDLF